MCVPASNRGPGRARAKARERERKMEKTLRPKEQSEAKRSKAKHAEKKLLSFFLSFAGWENGDGGRFDRPSVGRSMVGFTLQGLDWTDGRT